MTAEAIARELAGEVSFTAAAVLASGEVLQLSDGRAAVVQGLGAPAIGDPVVAKSHGIVELQKTASINILAGGRVFWDRSAGKATYKAASGDFYIGVSVKDSLAAATTVFVDLNVRQTNVIDFDGSRSDVLWTEVATLGLGMVEATLSQLTTLAFDAVAEVAVAAMYPTATNHHIPIADGPILEMEIAIYDIGDDAALDIVYGMVSAHNADPDAIAESFLCHLDGTALSITAESDDGTTEVTATDTTVDAVDDTVHEVWFDCRSPADCQLYIDGVNVLPDTVFNLAAATGPLFPYVGLFKSSNDTTADLRVAAIRFRGTDLP